MNCDEPEFAPFARDPVCRLFRRNAACRLLKPRAWPTCTSEEMLIANAPPPPPFEGRRPWPIGPLLGNRLTVGLQTLTLPV